MSMDEAGQKIADAVLANIGKLAITILLLVGGGLLSAQKDIDKELLDKVSAHSAALQGLDGKVVDLSNHIDDKYAEIKGEMNRHYDQVDGREDGMASSLSTMAASLATEAAQLEAIKEQLAEAKAQERADMERKNAERHAEVIDPPPAASIPIIGPIISAIRKPVSRKSHRFSHR